MRGHCRPKNLVGDAEMGMSPAASFYLLPALSFQSPSPGAMALTDLMGKALSGIPKSFYY